MLRNLIVIILILFLCSCSHTKDLQKKSITIKSDSTANITSITTSTETTTGTLEVKGYTLISEEHVDDLNDHPITIENENLKLTLSKDKKTGRIKATAIQKPKVIPVNITKVTNNKTDSKIRVKKETNAKSKDLKKETTGGLNLNYLWWLLLLIPLYILWNYFKTKNPG